ncbi:MAG: hypothetical protein EOP35_05115 [Rubrivivax sp.]|nr:MAG: hypothetical protein EOP35_05115 [Rubrivivax sp.]
MSTIASLDPIAGHADGCACPRCVDLTPCPTCERLKLDIDWCWACRRLVFLFIPTLPQGRPYFANYTEAQS